MADNIWLSRQKRVSQAGTIQVTAYDVTTSYRLHVSTTSGPFAFTLGTGGTVNTTAAALDVAWDARTEGEFTGVTATSATDTVTLTADTPGTPFTAVAAVSGGGGAIGAYTATVANLSNQDINDAVNWSDGIPNASDDCYVDSGDDDNSLKWNLGALSAVTLTSLAVMGTFTGDIGLPRKNEVGDHDEYFTEYFSIGITTLTINTLSGFVAIDGGSVASTINVLATGSPKFADLAAFIWKGTSASNAMRVESGSVDVAPYGSETANLSGGLTVNGGTVRCGSGVTLSGVTQNDGTLETSSALGGTTTQNGGSHVHRIGTVTALVLNSGTFDVRSKAAMTITDLTIGPSGVLDLTNAIGAVTVTNTAVLRPGATIIDPYNRLATTFTYSCVGGPNAVNVQRSQAAATIALS